MKNGGLLVLTVAGLGVAALVLSRPATAAPAPKPAPVPPPPAPIPPFTPPVIPPINVPPPPSQTPPSPGVVTTPPNVNGNVQVLNPDGSMQLMIEPTDLPYGLAHYYTGDSTRWPDLGAQNPQLGQIQTVNGVSNYSGWAPGVIITIPASWNPGAKPIPTSGQQS